MKTITIRPDGSIEYIQDDRLKRFESEATATVTRVSRIEPVSLPLRVAFLFLRSVVSDKSCIADWTRQWSCCWRVRIFGGPTFGSFSSRQEAINAEIGFIQDQRRKERVQ